MSKPLQQQHPHFRQQAAIGVFDSGLGGLTVLDALRAHLPLEHFLYFADTRYFPYGDLSQAFLRQRVTSIAREMEKQGIKALVIACNTATAASAEAVRQETGLPIIAMEPGIKPAVALSSNGRIGVMATTHTLHSQRFQKLVDAYAQEVHIIAQACPGLAEAIEWHGAASSAVGKLLDQYVSPLQQAEVDVVVLGCTHYPWVSAQILQRLSASVKAAGTVSTPGNPALTTVRHHILDTGAAVARQLQKRLLENSLLRTEGARPGQSPELRITTSGDPEYLGAALSRLYGAQYPVQHWQI